MKQKNPNFEFSADKNRELIEERGINFEDIITALSSGKLLETIDHLNLNKYPRQKMYVVEVNGYIYVVPFVWKDEDTVFLKTIFPSRKANKRYKKTEVCHDT